ncbi:MAG: hypothetical protein Kow0073_17550 [Immundisolibacter sp.]
MAIRSARRLPPHPDHGQLAVMFGGHGDRVDDPARIRAAVGGAVAAVRADRPAIFDVRIGDEVGFLAKMFAAWGITPSRRGRMPIAGSSGGRSGRYTGG